MYGRIALLLAVFYLLLNIMILHWSYRKSKDQFYDDEEYMRATLKKLLVTRHVGSPGHAAVCDFLDKELMRFGFISKRDDFFQGTNFSSVVGVWNDQAIKYLVLTCHYDGPSPRKGQEPGDDLVSATDGAVSCAILLTLAKTFHFFSKRLGRLPGLVVVFFDGHMPLPTDPANKPILFGSQHFVNTRFIPRQRTALVLTLNHIGAPNQTFLSNSQNLEMNHIRIVEIEQVLRKSGQLVDCHVLFHRTESYMNDLPDDHVPFRNNGLTALHISPEKYPNVHHKADDKAENLHWPTILNMIKILRLFIIDYLVSIDVDQYDLDFDYVE